MCSTDLFPWSHPYHTKGLQAHLVCNFRNKTPFHKPRCAVQWYPFQDSCSSWIIHCYTPQYLWRFDCSLQLLQGTAAAKSAQEGCCSRGPCRIYTLRHPPLWRGMLCEEGEQGRGEFLCVLHQCHCSISIEAVGWCMAAWSQSWKPGQKKVRYLLKHQMKDRRN